MKISAIQLKIKTGRIEENFKRMKRYILEEDSDLLIFPSLSLTGEGCGDLFTDPEFLKLQNEKIEEIIRLSKGKDIICPVAEKNGKELYLSAMLFSNGAGVVLCRKKELSLEQKKYFMPGEGMQAFNLKERRITVTLDEPFNDKSDFVINLSTETFIASKLSKRGQNKDFAQIRLNPVGISNGNIFDGRSFVSDKNGEKITVAKTFAEDVLRIDDTEKYKPVKEVETEKFKEITNALIFGFREFCENNGFKKAVLGLSGGIDSALTCYLAVKALGSKNVVGITMPSEFSSSGSVDDSVALAENLGIVCLNQPIKSMFDTFVKDIQGKRFNDLAEENLQSRLRGIILMNYSNRHGAVLLSTGNKSEVAAGYCTLYGDTCGGINLLSDVYKTEIYEICKKINEKKEIIPQSTIDKPPSAELKPNQKDSDSLPEYEILDKIIKLYFEQRMPVKRIELMYPDVPVDNIVKKIKQAQFKRNQLTSGFKISERSFVKDIDYPVM